MLLTAAAPFIVLASTVVANPIVVRDSRLSLPLRKRVKSTSAGRQPVHGLQNQRGIKEEFFNLTNVMTYYQIVVGIGNPATNYTLLVDTGNPFTWVGAGKSYVKTSASVETNDSFATTYGYGSDAWSVNGTIYIDNLFLGGSASVNVSGQRIGVVQGPTALSGISGVDGLLGLGPMNMTTGNLKPDGKASLPTVLDNMDQQQHLWDAFSVYFEPVNESSIGYGELTFGSLDFTNRKFLSQPLSAPISTTYPANGTWSVDVSITYGRLAILNETNPTATTPCIIDSKSAFNYFPSDAFNLYVKATGATPDPETGTLRLPSDKYENLQPLVVGIGNDGLEIIPNAQILPRALNKEIGGTSDYVYLTVKDIGSPPPDKPRCVLGIPFLERYFTTFDSTTQKMGFAKTSFTMSEIN